ncbi:MAG: inositol monophosphatase family protein [Candidatus Atabeyarchaeum deiterrae]
MTLESWMPVFRRAAENVRRVVKPLIGTADAGEVVTVKTEGDVTSKVDDLAEEAAVKALEDSGMDFSLVSEESGRSFFGKCKSETTIILDPIDGSANAIRGIPAYSFSIAAATGKCLSDVHEALVVDLARGEYYEGEFRKGAKCNGISISPSKVERLSESMISADLNIVDLRVYMKRILRVLNVAKRKRYLGTNALEICFVASGKYDAFIDLRGIARVTDIAAAYLVLEEAGGVMVGRNGAEVNVELLPTSKLSFIAAANRSLCRNIILNVG